MFTRRIDPIVSRLIDLGLSRSAAIAVSSAGTLLQLDAGRTLCTKGERGRQAFLLLDGEATVALADRSVTLGAGDVAGEIAVLDITKSRTADVVTRTAATVLVFDPAAYTDLASSKTLNSVLAPQRTAA
jgi:CRP-like cAMP-binding protein